MRARIVQGFERLSAAQHAAGRPQSRPIESAGRIDALLRGPVGMFFDELIGMGVEGPAVFEADGKLITITIEDLPDAD